MKNIYKKIIIAIVVLAAVSWGAQSAQAETYTSDLTLGSTGSQVISLQTWLEANGYLTMPPGVAKGYFGGKTRDALASYQRSIGFPAYGFFGPMTRERLNRGDNSAGALNVISPNGGEVWQKGTTQTIRWNSPRYFRATNVDIKLVENKVCSEICTTVLPREYDIIKNINANNNLYSWNVGNVMNTDSSYQIPNGQYFITICESGTNVCATSKSSFNITSQVVDNGSIRVFSPNGGEILRKNNRVNITWNPGNVNGNVNITLISKTACSLVPCMAQQLPGSTIPLPDVNAYVAKNISNSGTYSWNVGEYSYSSSSMTAPDGEYQIRICVANVCDSSDSYFTIDSSVSQPPVTMVSPNGGERLTIGSTHQIRWTNTNTSYGSKVDLYMTPVVACPMIYPAPASCYPADIVLDRNIDTNMVYNWIVGTDVVNNPIPAGNYMVKVCVAGTTSCDSSNGMFNLVGDNVSSTISPDFLPNASTNVFYRQKLKVAGLSTSTVQWQVIEGALPPGLYLEKASVACTTGLSSNCVIPDSMMFDASIAGQPTSEGNYAFKIKAYNNTQSVTKSYNINVGSGFTLRTDKSRYYTNDPINMTVTAYNSTNQPKVFNFNSGCQTTYRINNTSGSNFFDSTTNLICSLQLTSVVVPAAGSYTWSITHNPSTYRLPVGTYKIFGAVIGQAHFESEPFNVVQ
jgi:hypothetical protein